MNRTPLPISLLVLLALAVAHPAPAQQPAPAYAPATEAAAPAPAVGAASAPAALTIAANVADKPAAAADADAAAAPAAQSAAAKARDAAAAASKGKDAAGRDTLSVDFPDEDVRNILRNVADLFELNIIMPDTLQGKTTIKLRDVTWRQIFESVLQPVGYTYKEEGNIIKILSNESLNQEPVSTEVFVINYARAADIQPTISALIDSAAGGKLVVDTRSNSIVITERPSRMNRIRPIIEQLDRATDQVMIESKFVEVTDSDVKNIGVNWASLANYQLSAGSLGGTFQRTRDQTGTSGFDQSNGTTRTGTTGNTAENTANTTGTQTSGATNTGSVTSANGVVTSTSTTGNTGGLTNTTTNTATAGTTNALTDGVNNTLNNLASLVNNDGTGRTLNAVFSATEFKLILSALQAQSQVKIVSNPTIVTLNNAEAEINVGQERPIPRYQYNTQTGNLEVNGFEFKPIGVILRVTPQVNQRGFIKLTVAPEVSQSLNNVIFNGNAIPVIDTRKTKTQVSLRDGFTMGIGGLLTASVSDTNNKVPILGSIPVLGRLFRSDAKNIASTNLIIFITAKTISAEGAAVEQVFDSARVRQLQLRREDLPGHRDGSSPFVEDGAAWTTPPAKTAAPKPEAKK